MQDLSCHLTIEHCTPMIILFIDSSNLVYLIKKDIHSIGLSVLHRNDKIGFFFLEQFKNYRYTLTHMASSNSSQPMNLLIGKTGVGKSSLISRLSGRQLHVSHDTNRGTVSPQIIDIDDWIILDTRGLSDPEEVQRDEAVINLKKKSLRK